MPGKAILNRPDAGRYPEEPGAFAEPWQAQVFALVVALHERGLFSWAEWAQILSRHVGGDGVLADGSDYYAHWLAALQDLLMARGVAGADEIAGLTEAWQRAARATPHGQPILLENDPQRR